MIDEEVERLSSCDTVRELYWCDEEDAVLGNGIGTPCEGGRRELGGNASIALFGDPLGVRR